MSENFFCIADNSGVSCNYPIGVKKDGYTDNDLGSPSHGEVIQECPGCKRPLSVMTWDGKERDIDPWLSKQPRPMKKIFPR